jgi:hypothetical protein
LPPWSANSPSLALIHPLTVWSCNPMGPNDWYLKHLRQPDGCLMIATAASCSMRQYRSEDGPGCGRPARFSAMKIPSRTARARARIRRPAARSASRTCRSCPATGGPAQAGLRRPALGHHAPGRWPAHLDRLEGLRPHDQRVYTEVAEELTNAAASTTAAFIPRHKPRDEGGRPWPRGS